MNRDNEILSVIKFLAAEIEDEVKNNEAYEKAKIEAECKADEYNKQCPFSCRKYYWNFIPKYLHTPRKSLINANAKKIRQLCLKLYRLAEDSDE